MDNEPNDSQSTPPQKEAYINFMLEYRKKHCELPSSQALLLGARAWGNLLEEQRDKYKNKPTEGLCRPRRQKRPAAKCRAKKKPACRRKAAKKKKPRNCKKQARKKLHKPCKPAFKPRRAIKPAVKKNGGGGIRHCRPRTPKKLTCPKRRFGLFGRAGYKKHEGGEGEGDDSCKVRGKIDAGTAAKQCMRPGPVMSNGFLNFMREFREKNCGIDPKVILKRGARAWCRLTDEEKDKYRKMGCSVTGSQRRKNSKLCRDITNKN